MSKKILFISHEASRTGAPILLLNLARLLKEKGGYAVDFMMKNGGALEADFKAVGNTEVVFDEYTPAFATRIIRRLSRKRRLAKLKKKISQYHLVLSNTIINGDIHELLNGANVYTYVHELHYTIKTETSEPNLKKVLSHTKEFLVPSRAVETHLHQQYNVDLLKIRPLPYYIIDHFHQKEPSRKEVRKRLGIGTEAFVVGGMGLMGWRKGSDVFLQVAKKVVQQNPFVKFVWFGGSPERKEFVAMELDILKMGLKTAVMLLPSTGNSWQAMASFDVFFLSSREDPYPLVVLEAAMMALPIVCFDKSGGAPEFVENDCGFIVDYLDTDKACEACMALQKNSASYKTFSKAAREKYVTRHSGEKVLEAFAGLMNMGF